MSLKLHSWVHATYVVSICSWPPLALGYLFYVMEKEGQRQVKVYGYAKHHCEGFWSSCHRVLSWLFPIETHAIGFED